VPILHQTWNKLLFIHWPIAVEQLRRKIPAGIEIDTYDGQAWIGLTPFTFTATRPTLMPPVPILSDSHELNVRTYVYRDGVPGIWFFSLEASNALAVWGARLGYLLPYFTARMEMQDDDRVLHFRSERQQSSDPPATFEATWSRGERLPEARPGTLDFFLIERYCLYTNREDQLFRARIHHRPWPLCRVDQCTLTSTMLAAHGLTPLDSAPLLHAQAEPLDVAIWPLEKV
jgi:uncharacterized protein YqjF (DUF2071 family)